MQSRIRFPHNSCRHTRLWAYVNEVLAESRDTPEKQAARLTRCLRRQEEVLRRHYRTAPHLADKEHIERYAKKYTAALLAEREKILSLAVRFYSRRDLVEHLEKTAPQLLTFATWKVRALAEAEKLDVEPLKEAPQTEQKPERPKLTPEQFTERKVKWFTTKLKEEEAILKTGRAWLEAQEEEILAGIEDEEEREATRQHLESILGQALQTLNQNRKGG